MTIRSGGNIIAGSWTEETVVTINSEQTISGQKTFTSMPIVYNIGTGNSQITLKNAITAYGNSAIDLVQATSNNKNQFLIHFQEGNKWPVSFNQDPVTKEIDLSMTSCNSVTAPTPSTSDISTKVATTKFVNDLLKVIFPVGTVYTTVTNTNPSTILGFGTWSTIANHIVVDIAATAPVKGNGTAVGFEASNGNKAGLWANVSSFSNPLVAGAQTYGQSVSNGTSNPPTSGVTGNLGLTTEADKSGIITDTSTLATKKTVYIWQRTA